MRIAIIGAGMAGLSCACHLRDAGHEVILFDKGRGPGGRLSGRRHQQGAIDHGAQFFTVRDPAFQQQVDDWCAAGVAQLWQGTFVEETVDGLQSSPVSQQRYVCRPRMNGCIRAMANTLPVAWSSRVAAILGEPGAWLVDCDDGQHHGPFAQVICATPPAQAAPLLTMSPDLQLRVAQCEVDPCWALMAWCADLAYDYPWDSWSSVLHPALAWIAWEQRKPGRGGLPRLIVHASADWSRNHLELAPAQIIEHLWPQVEALLGFPLHPVESQAHRWRYAKARVTLKELSVYDSEQGIGVIGDWCSDARIEAAWLSGRDLALKLLTVGSIK